MELLLPIMQYQASYLSYIDELGDEERYPFPLDFEHHDFEAMLAKMARFAQGKDLPPGYAASTTLWLIYEGEIIGVTNIRHYLTTQIAHCGGHIGLSIRPSQRGKNWGKRLMQLSIEHLRQRGVVQVHLHCLQSNLASAKAIIRNGGMLDSEVNMKGQWVQRYVVDLK
ncbi:GNAT family N-acetyltransferase [Shewanella algidipiscicola]|uniref:Acetyltransferase n=1 Tax=Shewanella algidipiscicola TaxID=614070 RepID=A0ABQ4PNJ8_9GAMM|nr:GNAT family N-acetyltransferase [Shewanella algidipiscicola]GIU49745.1 acetyltransferase [Shewanella algidipiscicola]